jgi:hypothetical protein
MNESEPPRKCRNTNLHRNQRQAKAVGKRPGATCLLPGRCTAYRWHEPCLGLFGEQEKPMA